MHKRLCKAINEMEKACLSSDSTKTTVSAIKENGLEETKRYFYWLRQQAPITAMMIPAWEALLS